jgi:FkbM family methyltransferase
MVQKKLFDTKYGKIWMNVSKRYHEQHKNFEFEKYFVDILETEDYTGFIDIGAAWGYFTIVAANHCEGVAAFEPFLPRYEILKENIENLKLDNVIISKNCIGTGKKELFVGGNMVGPKTGVRQKSVKVEWADLGSLLDIAEPDEKIIIKIDVEGNEPDVIESAGNLEQYLNHIFLIERHQRDNYGYSEEELFKIMKPFKGELLGSRAWTTHYVFRGN